MKIKILLLIALTTALAGCADPNMLLHFGIF